jgi:YD repeat-containing protein
VAIEDGSNQLFNLGYMGNLSFIAAPNGNKLTLSYDQHGRLASVTDSANRKLEFTYEIGTTPLVGAVDTGSTNNDARKCTNKRYLRSVRRRFALAQVGTAWRIIKITGPGGLEVDYHYDDHGNLDRSERVGGDGISQATDSSLWQYAYDPNNGTNASTEHLLKTVQPPNQASDPSRQTTYEYESTLGGLMVKAIHQPAGVNNSYSRSFSTTGLVARADVTDGRGNTTHYDFQNTANEDKTSAQKTVTVTAPRGAVSTIVFDGYGGRLSETDPEGRQTITHYDIRGNADSQTVTGAGKSISTSATYDPKFDKPLTTVDGRGNVTTYTLDGYGNVTKIQLPTGRPLQMDYAANGDLVRMVDQYGFATTYEYDRYGNPNLISRQAAGQATVVMQNTYDDRSRLLSSTDTISPSVQNAYDALDRVVSQTITDPAGIRDTLTSTLAYLPEGQVRQVSQTGGQTLNVTNTYDGTQPAAQGNRDANGAGPFTREYAYDNNSNLLTENDRRGVTTTRTYDALNFVTSETVSGPFGQSLATMTVSDIDRVGNPLRVLDLYGQETTFEYDGLHRLVRRNVPGGFHEEIGYDDNGNVILQKDRNQRPTVSAYDPINRRTRLTDPAGRVTTWSYLDASHTIVRQSDPQGLTETVQADGLGRIVRREVKFGAADYITTKQYDGRSVQTTDPRGVVSIKQLSAFGETGDLTVNGATPAYRVHQSYGPFGGLKHSVDANGRESSYTLDGFNRPTQINRTGGFSEAFIYDGEGQRAVAHRLARRHIANDL